MKTPLKTPKNRAFRNNTPPPKSGSYGIYGVYGVYGVYSPVLRYRAVFNDISQKSTNS